MKNKKSVNNTAAPVSDSTRSTMPISNLPSFTAECPIGVCDLIAELIEDAVARDAELEVLKKRLAQIESWWRVLVSDVGRYIEQRQSGKDE